ncbi:MAG: hypothetical protein JNJ57_12290 [Saprospiraceae bacterium]|nr:hypothetical protein [Saprospiraceae bacterium]
MSQDPSNKQTTKTNKVFRTAAIVLILLVLPAISYYYLNSGLTIRKEALGKKESYGKIRPIYVIYPDGHKEDQLEGKVCVIHIFGEGADLTGENRKILDTAEKLFNQFGSNNSFRLAMIVKDGTAEFRSHHQKMPSSDYVTWAWNGSLGQWRTIIENAYENFCLSEGVKPVKEYFAVCDTSGQIRRFYNALDNKEIDKMAQHLAIMLPQ